MVEARSTLTVILPQIQGYVEVTAKLPKHEFLSWISNLLWVHFSGTGEPCFSSKEKYEEDIYNSIFTHFSRKPLCILYKTLENQYQRIWEYAMSMRVFKVCYNIKYLANRLPLRLTVNSTKRVKRKKSKCIGRNIVFQLCVICNDSL